MSASAHPIPELDRKGYRDFALTTSAILVVLFGILFPFVFDRAFPAEFPAWPWIIGIVLSLWGLVAPMTLKPLYTGWMKFGIFMGTYIMTPIIMGIVFFAMFMPMGLIMRLFGKDLLSLKLDSGSESYRVPSAKPPAKNLEKPF
jgi:hypothetical protein